MNVYHPFYGWSWTPDLAAPQSLHFGGYSVFAPRFAIMWRALTWPGNSTLQFNPFSSKLVAFQIVHNISCTNCECIVYNTIMYLEASLRLLLKNGESLPCKWRTMQRQNGLGFLAVIMISERWIEFKRWVIMLARCYTLFIQHFVHWIKIFGTLVIS